MTPRRGPGRERRRQASRRRQGSGETLHYKGTVVDKDTGKPIPGATVARSAIGARWFVSGQHAADLLVAVSSHSKGWWCRCSNPCPVCGNLSPYPGVGDLRRRQGGGLWQAAPCHRAQPIRMATGPAPGSRLLPRSRLARAGGPPYAGGTPYDRATAHLDAPLAIVDLGAFDANAADLVRRAAGKPIRVASKSVRCRALLERVLARDGFAGIMSFTLAESLWLARAGFDDVLLAYPVGGPGGLRRADRRPEARRRRDGDGRRSRRSST